MSGNFDYVDEKLCEADYFLEQINVHRESLDVVRYNFSAFVSAARSVTFTLQTAMKGIDGFKEWYEKQQEFLKSSPLARFFVTARNEAQKQGRNPVNTGLSSLDEDGKIEISYFFHYWFGEAPERMPDTDVFDACYQHMRNLVGLIHQCYLDFGPTIDPQQYYTLENLKRLGLSIDDIMEEVMGAPPGWVDYEDPEEILVQIRRQMPVPRIDHIFSKYLGLDRMGNVLRRESV